MQEGTQGRDATASSYSCRRVERFRGGPEDVFLEESRNVLVFSNEFKSETTTTFEGAIICQKYLFFFLFERDSDGDFDPEAIDLFFVGLKIDPYFDGSDLRACLEVSSISCDGDRDIN